MMLDGWAISKLWLWFVAEPFSVSPLTVAHCIGLSMLLSFALRRQPDLKKDDKDATAVFATIAAWWILTPITTVLLGWVVKSYLMV